MQVADGIHRLSQGVVNFYLVEDAGKLTLIDAGAPGDWEAFARAVGSLGRALDDLEAVLLTHAHCDHTGFAERARTNAHATVGSTVPTQMWRDPVSLRERGRNGALPAAAGGVPNVVRAHAPQRPEDRADPRGVHVRRRRDDRRPGNAPHRARTGHTEGSCAILFERKRVLVTGDALATRNPLTGRIGPQIAPDGLNRDSALALRSLDAFASLPADLVLPGHGDPWTEGIEEGVRVAKLAGRS